MTDKQWNYVVDDEVHFKLRTIKRWLEGKWGRDISRNELLDYLTDQHGTPEQHEETEGEPDDHRFTSSRHDSPFSEVGPRGEDHS